MKYKSHLWGSSLLVAMALGTAWAVRGKFGHEQGAAWAGGVGALALVLIAKRPDWYGKAFRIALAAAVGWGMGGMISYGVVVGYGRGTDFVNVYYGLAMLFVIGGLYGFTGGGLMGLAFIDSTEVPVKWHRLVTEMIAFGVVTYALLITQLEWLMTPPRSEMWAACFGASIAESWFIIRLKQWRILRLAIWSALGSGFGFAFGNVLQVMGSALVVPFNLWNVMEYSIGFFGGLGMAYATFTTSWAVSEFKRQSILRIVPIMLLTLLIPFVVWDQSFTAEKLSFLLNAGGSPQWIVWVQVVSLLSIAAMALIFVAKEFKSTNLHAVYDFNAIRNIFTLYLGVFTLLSFLVTGVYFHPVEQYLYVINIILILILARRAVPTLMPRGEATLRSAFAFVFVMVILAASAFVMIHAHGELKGSQMRFER